MAPGGVPMPGYLAVTPGKMCFFHNLHIVLTLVFKPLPGNTGRAPANRKILSIKSIDFEVHPEYLPARISSDQNDAGVIVAAFSRIAEKCGETGCQKLLVEHEKPESLTMGEAFNAAQGVVGLSFMGIRIADVDRDILHLETTKFGELVAVNCGVREQAFASLDEAVTWLTN